MKKIILDIKEFEREFDCSTNYTCSTYTKEINVDGKAIQFRLTFENCENENHAEFVSTITSNKFDWVRNNLDIIKDHIAHKMIELANDWEEEPREITISEFKNRIILYGFNSYFDEDFQLLFGDGDIFAGHDISIDITKDFVLDDEPSI